MALPNEKYTTDDYLEQNPSWDMEDSPWKAGHVHTILSDNGLNPESICEIGCGAGGVLASLQMLIPEVSYKGYDIAPAAAGFWKKHEHTGIQFELGDFFEANVKHHDVILLLDVLEHVVDPHQFLSGLKDKADYLVIHFPLDLFAFSVLRESPLLHVRRKVGHIHYFTTGLALELLKECGFDVVDWRYTGAAFSAPQRGLKTKIFSFFRHIVYGINKDFGVRLLGGETMMVLVRPRSRKI